jgi:hypothetical protein
VGLFNETLVNFLKLLLAGEKDGKDIWIEMAPGILRHQRHRLNMAHPRLVGSAAAQGVVDIGDGDDPRRDGDLFAVQTMGIAAA